MTDETHGPDDAEIIEYGGPAGGWGSVKSLARVIPKEHSIGSTSHQLLRQNKADGFMCVSCAWPKPAEPHPAEFCENGAKATAWELTGYRTSPDYFAEHSVTSLREKSDYELEQHGRLTHPLRYDAQADRYYAVSWEEAFSDIGAKLSSIRGVDPKAAVFYSSGRASLETSYMYALFARLYGNNNLPDSSNMCHETTSVALKKAIGAPVGTTVLDDFEHCDAIFFFGQNVGSNAPRMLHQLRSAVKRGCRIVTFNPLKERGLERFTDPQNPFEMATGTETQISSLYLQVRPGGDIAVLMGMCKCVIEWGAVDHAFIAQHTHGYAELEAAARAADWDEIERDSGLTRANIEDAARIYAEAKAVMGIYGMGLTQHVLGMHNVYGLVNLLLLRGNIGRPGAGICPVRGHSNVQGQRTVGISEKPELVPLDILAEQFGFEPPREKGLTTVEACKGILDGSVKAFVSLGGNFLRAVPDTGPMEAAWAKMALTVSIVTKLNRMCLVPGETSYILPCLGRIERDDQASGPQAVAVEDSTSCIHGSIGTRAPAADTLLSEPAIVAGIARATLSPNPKVPWEEWVGDYAKVRDQIEHTYPDKFKDFNARMFTPGGFYRGNKARELEFETESKKAEFNVPPKLSATGFADGPDVLRLVTLRSNDQFNTTVYGYDDRFRGISGSREVLLMNRADIVRLGLADGAIVGLETIADDGVRPAAGQSARCHVRHSGRRGGGLLPRAQRADPRRSLRAGEQGARREIRAGAAGGVTVICDEMTKWSCWSHGVARPTGS